MIFTKTKIPKNLIDQKNSSIRISLISYIFLKSNYPDYLISTRRIDIEKVINSLTEARNQGISNINDIARQIYYTEQDYEWIENSARQFNFIESCIRSDANKTLRLGLLFPTLLSLQGYLVRDISIALIDYYSISLPKATNTNIDLNAILRDQWSTFTKSDSNFNWLNCDNSDEARDYLWKHLNLKHSEHLLSIHKFRNHEETLQFFDKIQINDTQKLEINEKVKKLWIQREKRRNDSKNKQFNINLPISTIKAIEKLAKKYDFSKADIVRIVLDSEAQNNYHLNKKSSYNKHMLNTQSFDTNPEEQLSSKLVGNNNPPKSVLEISLENAFPQSAGSS